MVLSSAPRAVLCDLDGTLVETGPEIADAVNDTLEELGLPVLAEARVTAWVGHGTRELLAAVMGHVQQLGHDAASTPPAFEKAMDVFRRHYAARTGTRGKVYDGVRETLMRCQAHNIPLALVTNKDMVYARKSLEANGIDGLFEVMVCGDTFESRKPDPEGTLHALAGLNCEAADAVFLGDSIVDVQTARAAGVTVLTFRGGYNLGQDISLAEPDAIFDHWQQVSEMLGLI